MTEWFAEESFWETFYDIMFPEARFDASGEQVEQIQALTNFEGRDVLDLCCGPGRLSVLLAKRGFSVTGVDLSPFLLGKARQRADADGAVVEWVEEDMRNFVRPGAFDLVINAFTSFGYFDDKTEDVRVLRNVFESLRDEGVLVIEILGKEYLAKVFQPTVSMTTEDGSVWIQRHEIFDDWSRIRNEWILVQGERARSFEFHHTVYSAQELKDRLREAGFAETRAYGGLDGSEYGPDANRLVLVATKKA
jgi:SAM-dependent methyltransferase